MIDPAYVRLMARYNRWQNRNLYEAAETLDAAARRLDRGAFFRSIHGTLSHLAWADAGWLHRFDGTPKPAGVIPDSADAHPDWEALKATRAALDVAILDWAGRVTRDWLDEDMRWRSSSGRDMAAPRGPTVVHFFNHQTHHRGQVHAMLTAAGAKPGDTDLVLMPTEA